MVSWWPADGNADDIQDDNTNFSSASISGNELTLNPTSVIDQSVVSVFFPTTVGNYPLLNPRSLGEDAGGELYICDIGSGNVFQIVRGRR
ncbi:MAG: hypothetical protein ACR2II_09470 [Chthoniobacterales bacterium]